MEAAGLPKTAVPAARRLLGETAPDFFCAHSGASRPVNWSRDS